MASAAATKAAALKSAFTERLPFAEAIADDNLLGKPWRRLSIAQQVALKVMYGLELDAERRDEKGFNEFDYFSAYQGQGIFDELGYLIGILEPVPYKPKEYDTVTGVIGRRSGKSTEIAGFAGAYEITLGGHTPHVLDGQDIFFLYIAQDLSTALTNMKAIKLHLQMSPLLGQEILNPDAVEEYKFKNGIILRAEPPSLKTSRGMPVAGIIMDEVGFWYKEAKSANPDYEVVRAVDYAMSQFPHAKQFRFSTPWTKEGILYEAHLAGTEGRNLSDPDDREEHEGHVVFEAPTAMMGNPKMTRKRLLRLRRRDKEAFERESLGRFTGSRGTFLPSVLVSDAVERGQKGPRSRIDDITYVASMDPGWRKDTYAFNIWHHSPDGKVVQDVILRWVPVEEEGGRINPAEVLDEIKPILEQYDLYQVYSDQSQLESLQQLALDRGFAIIGTDFTAGSKSKILGSLASFVKQRRLVLLDDVEQETELTSLVKTNHPSGYSSIAAPPNKHDDLAMCAALGAHQTLFYLNLHAATPAATKEDSLKKQLMAHVRAKYANGEASAFEVESARFSEMMNILFLNQEDDNSEGDSA